MVIKTSIIRLSYSLILLAQLLLAVAVFVRPAQAQTPVGYWTFDDRAGTKAVDSSGNRHTATLVNGVKWVSEPIGNAVSANAAQGQYVLIPAIDLSGTSAVTVTLWANRTYSTIGRHALFEATSNYANSVTGFGFFPDDADCNGIQAALHGDLGYTANCYCQPSSGVWHHLAVVFDKSQTGGEEITFYVDGVLQTANQSLSASTNTNRFGNNLIYLFSRAGITEFTSGMIGDLRIYGSALTAEQIQQIYGNAGSGSADGTQQQFTAARTYPITMIGSSGGINKQAATGTLMLAGSGWQQGFDFRNTATFLTDPPGSTYVLSGTVYPTTVSGVTFGWAKMFMAQARDRSTSVDPRLAGINFVSNGSPATFYVDLPSAGTYNLSLAMGDEGYPQCSVQCQIQFLDGRTVLATVTGGLTNYGYFYDAKGNDWSAAAWPSGNLSQQVTLTGTRLTMILGTNKGTGDNTPIAFLGVAQVSSSPNFTISASPAWLSIQQGNQGTSSITTTIGNGFNGAISLSASGMPSGTTVSFNPSTIPAPGSGSSTMTITVGSRTVTGTYPITVTGSGGGIQQNTTVTLTVTAQAQPNFTISASPGSLSLPQGNQGTSTITTTVSGGFNNSISLSASGLPSGTTVSFNPNLIPAPGSGDSTMTITVGSSTAVGAYPMIVTGNGGGIQQNATVTLTVTAAGAWQQGFDFRNTSTFVTDPSGDTYVLPTTAYPTKGSGVTYGWVKTSLVSARDRNAQLDPHLAGINYATNGSPATFYVDLPSPGTYSLSLAMGDDGYQQCYTQCQIQFLDGTTVLATLSKGLTRLGYFYDVTGNNWSAAQWPSNNVSQQVTLAGTRLTVVMGLSQSNGDITPLAFLGVAQVSSSPNFAISASPASLSVQQGNQGTSTLASTISGGFNSAISLSASGVPSGTTVSFSPNPIAAPGSGNSTISITVGSSTVAGTYPITVTGNGGGIQQNATVTLTVTADPNFTTSASPASLSVQQGNQGTSTITTTIIGGFNSVVSLSTSGIPTGTTVSFNPNPIPAPGSGSSTMTITVGGSTPVGTYPITVTGDGGGTQQNTTLTLTVTAAPNFALAASPASLSIQQGNQGTSTLTTTISGGFNSAVSLSPSGMPSGTTVSFHPNPIPAPGSGNSTMTITVGASTPTGTYPITVTGNGGGIQQNTTVTLTVVAPPNFTISASPAFLSVVQGNQGTSTITTIISGGFNSAISLSASGGPTGTTVSFNPNPIPAPGSGNSTMTITVGSSTPTGTYPITVTANGGGIQQNTTVTLTVTAAPNFTISASPASLSVVQGNQGTSTITTTISGGFNSAISLSASGMPSGTTVSFNPNPISAPGSGNSSMTITVGASTPTGTYPITLTGNGGGIQQSVSVTLTVTAQVALSWTASTSPGIAGYNAYRSITSGGPYTKLNSSLITVTSYTDQGVNSGNTYYYVTTAVNSQGLESVNSNEAAATVP